MTKIFSLFVIFLSANCLGQKVFINPGVDTTDIEIVKAITVWTNYLNSKPNPENMQTSPFWDETEKKKYPVVDQLYNSLGDTPPYEIGKPTILYVILPFAPVLLNYRDMKRKKRIIYLKPHILTW